MKILNGIDQTVKYLSELRKDQEYSVLTNGNGYYKTLMNPNDYARQIIKDTKKRGDIFLKELSTCVDEQEFLNVEISKTELEKSLNEISQVEISIIRETIDRITEFQKKTLHDSWFDESNGYGESIKPIKKVGCYIPGGVAPLISTILMTVVPAKVAGVKQIIVSSPTKGDAFTNKYLMASAYLSGVDAFFTYGGPQAIVSMAVGTSIVPKVDMICGPGNIFVTSAKKAVYGEVGLDGMFGPTETLIIADNSCDLDFIVADLLAQAEHDVLALPMLLTVDYDLANRINELYVKSISKLSKKNIILKSMNRGFISIVDNVDQIVELANEIAAEHTSIASEALIPLAEKIDSSGSLFLGENSPEVLADYVAGPSHVMPTNGTSKFSSSLSARMFLKSIPVLSIDKEKFLDISNNARILAKLETLDAHESAINIRRNKFNSE